MPADLDELFTAMGRQADTLPLAGADHARQRGRSRRVRSRAALAAAVAVLLVGVGVTVTRERRGADPILPATHPARIRGLAPLGEPLRLADGRMWTAARISGDRVIGFSGDAAGSAVGSHETFALDTTTGATAWKLSGQASSFLGVFTTPEAVMLLNELRRESEASDAPGERSLEFHDPATGAKRWALRHTSRDRLVLHEAVLVRLVGATGSIEAHDLVTGKRLWAVPSGADRPRVITGTRTGADHHEIAGDGSGLYDPSSQKAFPYTDDRLVQLGVNGGITVRDIRTGKVRSTVQGRPDAETVTAYEDTVLTAEPGDGGWSIGPASRILYRSQQPWDMTGYFLCATDRLCVYETREGSDGRPEARQLLIDTTNGDVLRTTGAVLPIGVSSVRGGHLMTSGGGGMGGNGTALYDENGRPMYSDSGFGGFIDDGNVLTLTQDARDRTFVARGISNIDFREAKIGTVPEISGRCDWTEELLACPAGRELWVWRFTR